MSTIPRVEVKKGENWLTDENLILIRLCNNGYQVIEVSVVKDDVKELIKQLKNVL